MSEQFENPGEMIMHYAKDIPLKVLAEETHLSLNRLIRTINNEIRITPPMALRLAQKFKVPPTTWMKLSDNYHDTIDRKKEELC